jgi:hypothetical protein
MGTQQTVFLLSFEEFFIGPREALWVLYLPKQRGQARLPNPELIRVECSISA